MSKVTKKTLIASIVQNTGVKPASANRALEVVLEAIKKALADGRAVDLGKLGRLSVVTRTPRNRINRNLKHVGPNIDRMHKKHPRRVRLTKRHDLSENPLPTVVTRQEPSVRRVRACVAFPSWRRRTR